MAGPYRAGKRGGGGSGGSTSIANGTTPITGGTNKQLLFNNAGVVQGAAGSFYDLVLGVTSMGTAVIDMAGSPDGGGGNVGYWQIFTSINGGAWFNVYNGSAGAGARGGFCADSSGNNAIQVASFGNGYSTSRFGQALANWSGMLANEKMFVGNKGAFSFKLGTNSTTRIELEGDGRSVILETAITFRPTVLTGAGIAATSTVGLGNYHFTSPGANRAHTLVARSAVLAGYRVTYSVVGAIGVGNVISLTRNGSDTIEGGTATLELIFDYASVTLEAVGTVDWMRVAKS